MKPHAFCKRHCSQLVRLEGRALTWTRWSVVNTDWVVKTEIHRHGHRACNKYKGNFYIISHTSLPQAYVKPQTTVCWAEVIQALILAAMIPGNVHPGSTCLLKAGGKLPQPESSLFPCDYLSRPPQPQKGGEQGSLPFGYTWSRSPTLAASKQWDLSSVMGTSLLLKSLSPFKKMLIPSLYGHKTFPSTSLPAFPDHARSVILTQIAFLTTQLANTLVCMSPLHSGTFWDIRRPFL